MLDFEGLFAFSDWALGMLHNLRRGHVSDLCGNSRRSRRL